MELLEHAGALVSDFVDPKKRLFLGYVALSVLIGFAWLALARKAGLRGAAARIFDRRILLSRSSRADAGIYVINRMFTLMISPLLITQLAIATGLYTALHGQELLRPAAFADAPAALVAGLFSAAMFVADDLSKYLVHRWMHRIPFLWHIHKVHHSAETLTPLTVYRVHPLEGVLYALRGAAAQGGTLALFFFLFGPALDLLTVLGVNALVFAFHVAGSNLRHSHVDIHYWPWLERILISPAQHQLHHSTAEEHFDRNFGAALAVWDWAFGSLHLSERGRALEFGVTEAELASASDLRVLYWHPARDSARALARAAGRLWRRIAAAPARLGGRFGRRLRRKARAPGPAE